ncbi:hypothetical protein AAVH_13906 [Aphelenchoides avenae]|nr:hypothetical protein AAVH_13906 [Aphelenchus avenae]
MDSKETDEKEQAEGSTADQGSKEDNKREASEKLEESTKLRPTQTYRQRRGLLETGKSFVKSAFSVGSKLWQRKQSDVPAGIQSTSPAGEATGQLDSGQVASTSLRAPGETSTRPEVVELERERLLAERRADEEQPTSGSKDGALQDGRDAEQGQTVGGERQVQPLPGPDAGARAGLYHAIFGYYWPIFKWLLVVTDGELTTWPWGWWLLYQALYRTATGLLFVQGVRLVWILVSTLLMADFTLELYFVTVLAYTTAHGFFSRILLHKFARKGRYRKAAFKCRDGWLNAWCTFFVILLIASGAFYPFVALWDLTSKDAADQFVQPILSRTGLTSPWWFAFDATSLFLFGTLSSVALIIGLFLTKSALSEAADTYKQNLEEVLNELSPAMPDEDVLTKFRSLHEHLIELMELSRRMYGGEGKDAFHVTFLCFMSIMLPSQSAIPFVLARAYKEHMFYMHLALLLSWLVTGLIVTISILVWLLKPVKEIAKLKITLRLSKPLNLRTNNDIHILVNRMVMCMDDTGVNPLSNKRVFFSSPFLARW